MTSADDKTCSDGDTTDVGASLSPNPAPLCDRTLDRLDRTLAMLRGKPAGDIRILMDERRLFAKLLEVHIKAGQP